MCRQTLYGSSVRLLYIASKLATQIADWFSAGALHLQILQKNYEILLGRKGMGQHTFSRE